MKKGIRTKKGRDLRKKLPRVPLPRQKGGFHKVKKKDLKDRSIDEEIWEESEEWT